jgi:predicted nucleic acid-binding protein
MILLDTNVISELVRVDPDARVIAYVGNLAPETVFTAAVCLAEIRYGLARMPGGRRRDDLTIRLTTFFEAGFQDQILPFDAPCATLYGDIRYSREAAGKPITVEDAMIAATARAYDVQAVATRNTKDFTDCGVRLIDPWQAP